MPSKNRSIIYLAALILLLELLILLFFFHFLSHIHNYLETLFYLLTITAVITPILYIYIIKPYIQANLALQNHMTKLALHDDLTQLGNRRALHENLSRLLALNTRHALHGAVLYIDLDKFKSVNDQYGHDVGDAVLIAITQRLINSIRKEDIACRVGGDEFVLLLGFLDSDMAIARQKALQIAARIVAEVKKPIFVEQHTLHISLSIGLQLITSEQQSIDLILKNADAAMYQAKQSASTNIMEFNGSQTKH